MKKLLYVALLAAGVVIMMAPPVMAQEEKPFTIHGEVRFRGEYDNNTSDFDNSFDDGALFYPYRVRIAAEGKFAKNVSAWIEFQNASVANATTRFGNPFSGFVFGNDTGSGVEMYQGNITLDQLWSKNFSLRIGRQEIVAGNELLLGDLDFYSGLSHDGVVGNWKLKKVNLMLWYTRPVEGSVSDVFGAGSVPPDQQVIAPGTGSGTQNFLGGYATWTFHKDQSFDVYLMNLNDRGTGGNFQTLGARYARDTTGNGIFWDAEYAQQMGQAASEFVSGAKVDANGHAIEGWFGYNWKARKNVHRVFARLEEASGDKTTSTKDEGFIPLFGDFHNRLGHGDWFQMASTPTALGGGVAGGGTGIQGLSVGYTGNFKDRHEFGAAYWQYKLTEQNASVSKDLGKAVDVWYGFNYTRNVNFLVSLSQLSPDDALTGGSPAPSDKVDRIYGQVRLRF